MGIFGDLNLKLFKQKVILFWLRIRFSEGAKSLEVKPLVLTVCVLLNHLKTPVKNVSSKLKVFLAPNMNQT